MNSFDNSSFNDTSFDHSNFNVTSLNGTSLLKRRMFQQGKPTVSAPGRVGDEQSKVRLS